MSSTSAVVVRASGRAAIAERSATKPAMRESTWKSRTLGPSSMYVAARSLAAGQACRVSELGHGV
jgi:hypothetical protein